MLSEVANSMESMSGTSRRGVQSLAAATPRLMDEWHPTLNGSIRPENVASRSTAKYWWKCGKGHEWQASASNRSKRGDGCPYCSGRYAIPGQTDLATTMPAIAATWHPTLNEGVDPTQVKKGSGLMAWWLCENGHSYKCPISSRSAGVGCGECYRSGMSNRVLDPGSVISDKPLLLKQFDALLNIDFDPNKISVWSKNPVHWKCTAGHNFTASPSSRIRKGKVVGCPVCTSKKFVPGENDFGTKQPEIAKSFDLQKNAPLLPEHIRAGDKSKYWWVCPKGHSYHASLASRIHNKSGCPVCLNQKTLSGFNDMATTHPALAAEFDRSRNLPSTPENIVAGVRRKLWWICKLGHSYEAAGYARIQGSGCPVCANKKVLKGFNDMATTHPALAAEFDRERNLGLDPEQLNAGTNLKLWWVCSRGHSYCVSGMKRVSQKTNCPVCASVVILPGFNDMATLAPQLIPHFHPTKNAPHTPQTLAYRTNKKLWWVCEFGHEYEAKPGNRLQVGGLGCPVCSNHQVLVGFNDLATTRPDLLKSWHPTKNLPTTPQMVLSGTNKKFWWICPEGHEWYAYLSLRSRGRDCPRCSKGGYDATKPGWLYFISSTELNARKVGISNFEFKRLAEYEKHWKLIKLWKSSDGLRVAEIETRTLRWIRRDLDLPQYLTAQDMKKAGGASETFSPEGVSDLEVISFIDALFRGD